MRLTSCWLALALIAALAPTAQAQRWRSFRSPSLSYSVSRPGYVLLPGYTSVRVQTSVSVPDGGTALVGGFSSSSEARSESGVPILGKVPVLGRGFRNVGYGRSTTSSRVSVRARIIDLREEEYRQTGYRSP